MKRIRVRYLSTAAVAFFVLLLTTFAVHTSPMSAQGALPGCWSVDTNAIADTNFTGLQDIDGTGNNVWAVGYRPDRELPQTYTAHWDGSKWSRVPAPAFENGGLLRGVSVLSKDDAWAVGVQGNTLDPPMRALTLHWNGTSWAQVSTPDVSGRLSELEDVAAVAPDDVWAVGYIEPLVGAIGGKQAIILHYDGHAWRQVMTPAIPSSEGGSGYSTLESLAVVSTNDIWAVGAGPDPMALHWNGMEWSRASMPAVHGLLHSVTAISPNDIWAVGNKYPDNRGIDTLTMHWDGTAWSMVPSLSNSGTEDATYWLESVAALAKDDVWAVGYMTFSRTPPMMVILRWDGRVWNQVSRPPLPDGWYEAYLTTVTNVDGNIWTAGVHGTGVLLRYSASPCAATPTPTPVLPLNPPVPLPGNGSHLFPETGKTMTGVFLDYWNTHGGLPQQGYPISEVLGEVSDLNQGLYTMQYTERAVFEYHPEYQPPFNVLLSQLGTFQYKKKYPSDAPGQKPNNDPGSVLFKETGKRLGGSFLSYWRANGGLMQQGYPISDEFVEVSPLDRKPYTVQYFERAVFEYHPELKGTQYEVLLSQLGTYRWREKYGTSPAHTLTPIPTQQAIKQLPDGEVVGGHYVFWRTGHGQVSTIDGYDLDQNRQFVVTTSSTNKRDEVTDGRLVVWDQDCPPYCHRLRAYDLQARREYAISEPVTDRAYGKLWLDQSKLYYQKFEGRDSGLYEYDLSNGQEKRLYLGQFGPGEMFQPTIEDGILLWSQSNENQTEWKLHMRKLDGSIGDTVLATGHMAFSGYPGYHASGDIIVWSVFPGTPEEPQGDTRVFAYNISSGTTRALSTGTAYNPWIRDNIVVWKSHDSSPTQSLHSGIQAYDLSTGLSWTVVPDRGTEPMILGIADGQRLVFSEWATGNEGYARRAYVVDLVASGP